MALQKLAYAELKQADPRARLYGFNTKAGATNAGLLAAAILATGDAALAERLKAFRAKQTASVAERPS